MGTRNDEELDEAFGAFEGDICPRPVLDVERERIARGHPADEALLKHGGAIKTEMLRALEQETEVRRAA